MNIASRIHFLTRASSPHPFPGQGLEPVSVAWLSMLAALTDVRTLVLGQDPGFGKIVDAIRELRRRLTVSQ